MSKKQPSPPHTGRVKLQAVFIGSRLSSARQIVCERKYNVFNAGKPIWAIDADGELHEFPNVATVERECRISSGRISSAINDFKKGKREIPLVEGFVWCYCKDDDLLPSLKAWIALNAKDNRKTSI